MRSLLLLILTLTFIITSYSQTSKDYDSIGTAKYLLKDYKGAIADYTMAIENNPKNEKSYYSRAFSKQIIGDYKGAIED